MGQRQDLIAALVALEQTVDPAITVYPLRPLTIDPPAIYNWILPSTSDIPATSTVVDTLNVAVRVVVPTGDIDAEALAGLGYADSTADVFDADLIRPAESVLRDVAHYATRRGQRTLNDTFDSIPYLAWEFVVQVELRKIIPPS